MSRRRPGDVQASYSRACVSEGHRRRLPITQVPANRTSDRSRVSLDGCDVSGTSSARFRGALAAPKRLDNSGALTNKDASSDPARLAVSSKRDNAADVSESSSPRGENIRKAIASLGSRRRAPHKRHGPFAGPASGACLLAITGLLLLPLGRQPVRRWKGREARDPWRRTARDRDSRSERE
ncbi:hypothetical protein MRX96_006696 [Rhipicephalus microplus]